MAAENSARSEARRKRVQRLKKGIIISLTTSILIPIILCIFLLVRLFALESRLKELEELLNSMQMQVSSGSVNMGGSGGPERIQESAMTDLSDKIAMRTDSQAEEVLQVGQEEPVRKVYLTFDDGPSSGTDEILDILAEYDVKATFFVVGKETEWAENAYRRIVAEGHTLGMHSYTHNYQQIYASSDAYTEDLLRLRDYLYDVTGVKCVYVRFPGGSSNTVSRTDMYELIACLKEEGFTYFDWNVSSQDASGIKLTPEQIVNNCLDGMEDKGNVVILMHDAASKHTTVEALPMLIESIQAMENTELLPITEDTVPVQHITISYEETEE